jgi:ribosomal protein S18 acetylase RimI-like enzyme
MSIEYRILGPGDDGTLASVSAEVFDHAIDAAGAHEFLNDARHHIAVAIDDGVVVGFASGLHYLHPDKPRPELWVNEVGVADTHRGRGIGSGVLRCLLDHGRALGCGEAWVLTERSNEAAIRLYASVGGREPEDETVMFSFSLGETQ